MPTPELVNFFTERFACQIECDFDCCRTGCYATDAEIRKIGENFGKIQMLMNSDVRSKLWHKLGWSALSKSSPFKYAILSRARHNGSKTCVFHRVADRKCAIHLVDYKLKPIHCRVNPFVSLHALYLRKELTPEAWHKKCKGVVKGQEPFLRL